jgi:AbrB family looped-hinge helix DNA binding protein
MTFKTKISKGFQTVVPADIRKKFGVGPGDTLEWVPTENGIELRFRKKLSLWDIAGVVEVEETDAVELKKRAQRGEKI